jgi:hypothetical protein
MNQAQSPGNGMGRGDAEINSAAAFSSPILPHAASTCGRCGGRAAPDGAWCDNCIRECREHTLSLDLKREAAS